MDSSSFFIFLAGASTCFMHCAAKTEELRMPLAKLCCDQTRRRKGMLAVWDYIVVGYDGIELCVCLWVRTTTRSTHCIIIMK